MHSKSQSQQEGSEGSSDLTEKQRIETALKQSEERLQSALTAGQVGTADYEVATHTVRASERFAEMFGFPAGDHPADDFIGRLHPEDRAQLVRAICTDLRDSTSWEADLRLSLPHSRSRWLSCRAAVERDESGNAIRLRGTAVDITARKLSELALAGQNRILQMMTTNAPFEEVLDTLVTSVSNLFDGGFGGILLKRDDHLELVASPELRKRLPDGTLKLPLEDLRGSSVCALRTGSPTACEDIANEDGWDSEIRNTCVAVGIRSSISRPIQLSDGETVGCFAMYFETARTHNEQEWVTLEHAAKWASVAIGNFRAARETRTLEQQMLQAQKLESLGILAGGIAHDFNNILTGILGNTSLAMTDMVEHPHALELLRRIETATLRAAELTNQMLAYSGKGSFIIQAVQVSDLVDEMKHLLESVIPKKVRLRPDLDRSLPLIEGDVTQLRQVIMNLIVNGAEAIGEHTGEVSIRTRTIDVDEAFFSRVLIHDPLPKGRYVALEVSDTGDGMDESTRERIFDPFFTTKFTGRGLGLAAVLGIVRAHRGAIEVGSRPGEGTSVRVIFPPIVNTGKPTASDMSSGRDATKTERLSVLVVDDEPLVLEVATQALLADGHDVVTAVNGKEALELFRNSPEIAVVLLDLSMPEMDGHEAFVAMQKIRPVPVVLTSGFSEYEMTRRFTRSAPAGFLQKPFRASEVAAKISEALRAGATGSPQTPGT